MSELFRELFRVNCKSKLFHSSGSAVLSQRNLLQKKWFKNIFLKYAWRRVFVILEFEYTFVKA